MNSNNKRRDFLKKLSLGAGALALGGAGLASCQTTTQKTNHTLTDTAKADEQAYLKQDSIGLKPEADGKLTAQPDAIQKAWMQMGFGLFIHYGINTYYDKEWSEGDLDPVKFNPTKLDTDQWCRNAKAAGMKYVVMITKHHDGFCLWPSKYTKYSVASTPFKGDVVAELANSCQKHGLKLGLYYSLWDCHEPTYQQGDWAYLDFMLKQLEELLTNYGDVVELWFDGFWKKQANGWKGSDNEFIDAWRVEGAYRWNMDYLYGYIKSLQPNCLVMNNSTTAFTGVPLHPVDIRSGEKATKVKEDTKVWKWLGKPKYMPLQIETTMSKKGDKKFPSGSWFWHEWDNTVVTPEEIHEYLSVAKAMEGNLLLNTGIDPTGRMRPLDENALKMYAEKYL